MQNGADKAMAAVSVVITAARPVAIVGKKLEHEIEQLHRFCDFRFGHRFACLRSGSQTHGITGRPNPHRARVPARFSGCGAPNRQGDRKFESGFLQRRVNCEPDFRGASHHPSLRADSFHRSSQF